ncbi:hypothetical protein [Halomonas lysinitropha]|uniref:Uncharacterized protein n=1 Tax=Halomonas lysinitropha TaxID=2607506 RepID=A0A5K1I9R0_9GAMM|nr:hypothetical protein [Halomonas lysinitropha]VVZ96750.1 hypothetical protein HALO32_02857 [Halomonas lysinitropha]
MYDESRAALKRGKNAPSGVSHSLLPTRSNAERVRLWHLHQVLGQHGSPVALSLQSIQLDRWKEKTLCHRIGNHSISPELRFYYLALEDLVSKTEGWKLGFITVNFSDKVTKKLAREAKLTVAGANAKTVNERLRKLGVSCKWFSVIEDHKGNLHSHCVIGYHQDDEAAVRSCFKLDTDNKGSGFRLQHTYKQRPRKISKQTVKAQVFTNRDGLGDYRMSAIDIGSADYISKTLENQSNYMDSGRCRIYVPNQIRTSAENRYESARTKQNRLTARNPAVSNLSCHQAMTYLHHAWIPKIVSAPSTPSSAAE